jgi:hypothetical protein
MATQSQESREEQQKRQRSMLAKLKEEVANPSTFAPL